MIETREQRIRRLIHRASYTGMKETDRVLGGFARAHCAGMGDDELAAFEELLGCGDAILWGWVSGREAVPRDFANPLCGVLIARLMTHIGGRG